MNKREKDLLAVLSLNSIPGLGARKVRLLLEHFGDPTEIFKASKSALREVEGIGEASSLAILSFKDWDTAESILKKTSGTGIQILLLTDPDYPKLLSQIFDPPVLLWVRGNKNALDSRGLAIVGTRDPSRYGKDLTIKMATDLAGAGLTIFSGMAYGIDTIAHHMAVKAGTKTVAVMGSGIDWIYPESNRFLAEQIVENDGAIITEFPPGTKPDAGNFPVRNRIVSGLSLGVLVMESGMQGGSMITADQALDQNREVFAIPHPMNSVGGSGCNYLIKTGAAKLVQHVDDILQELPGYSRVPSENGVIALSAKKKDAWKEVDLDPVQTRICEVLSKENRQIDHLADIMNMDTSKLLVSLLEMEMKDLVVQRAGKIFELSKRWA